MRNLYRLTYSALVVVVLFAGVPAAAAHPLGNFTVNQYAGLTVGRESILVDYVLDMAEIPAFQTIAALDANGNGRPDDSETAGYPASQCEAIRAALGLQAGGQPATLTLTSSRLDFPPGAGGLLTLRLTCAFRASILALTPQPARVEFDNRFEPDRLGWREIVVAAADGVTVEGDVLSASPSRQLTAYPQDMLTSPLDRRQARFTAGLSVVDQAAASPSGVGIPVVGSGAVRGDGFTELINLPARSLPAMLLALAAAFVWGGLHALTPGHGKTVVAAYLVGSRGTARHALYLGLTTTITHTVGVFALGLVTLLASRLILPERLFPWLSLISGALVVGIGVDLLASRLRQADLWPRQRVADQVHHHSPHPDHHHGDLHHHHHDHDHHDHHHGYERGHDHGALAGHSHLPPGADGSPVTWRSLLGLGISGGLLPCPSALVVMLSAIALDRVGFGLVLVVAFSLGLAGVLTAIGLALVYARRQFQRLPVEHRLFRLLPAVSALVILVAGLGITIQALAQLGLFNAVAG